MPYHNATICLNGHVLSKKTANSHRFCPKCGKETFSHCPSCNSPIHGLVRIDGVAILYDRPYDIPYYCYECGSPYQWTKQILDNAVELLALDEELDSASKELIKNTIPELIVDTPTTPIAIAKYQKGMSKAGQIIKDTMRQLLVDVISETAKKALFP